MPYLDLSKGRLHYHKFGNGAKLMLGLHGFGQQAELFRTFEKYLGNEFTFYAIDLPFHSVTTWSEETFSPADVGEWIELILKKEGKKNCSLLGHSLGGRIWLSCLPKIVSKVDLVVLLAPDGVATKGMSLPDLIPIWCRKGMAKTVQKPAWLLKVASWLYQSKLLSAFAYKYLQYHFRTSERQQCLLRTWISLSHFKLNLKEIARSLEEKKELKLITFLGKTDPLIKPDQFQAKAKTIPQMEITILPGGHHLVNKNVAEKLIEKIEN